MNRISRRTALAAGLSTVALAAPACATRPSSLVVRDVFSAREIWLSPGPIPPGCTFAGSYLSPHLGVLSLEQKGDRVTGHYEHRMDEFVITGQIEGTARGNLVLVEWIENQTASTKSRNLRGLGFFLHAGATSRGSAGQPGPAMLFGRRSVTIRQHVSDADYEWLASESRGELWTAVAASLESLAP